MKILVAEDSSVSRRMLELQLSRWGYAPVTVADGEEAWRVLQSPDAPKLAVIDWMLPGLDGLELCRRVRARGSEPYVYILLVTGKDSKEDLLEGLDAGADDYLAKPYRSQELELRLRTGKRIIALQEELVAAREALRRDATYDGLTGLLNRKAIVDLLRRDIERSRRERTPVSVVMADLDHFKSINDTYGHAAGDRVLESFAKTARTVLRTYDVAGRWGGEEFLIVLTSCDSQGAQSFSERLRARVENDDVDLGNGMRVKVTCSLGAATYSGSGGVSGWEGVVGAADAALYRAKRSGRNRTELANAEDFG